MRKKDFVAVVAAAIVLLVAGGILFGLTDIHSVPLDEISLERKHRDDVVVIWEDEELWVPKGCRVSYFGNREPSVSVNGFNQVIGVQFPSNQ